MLITAIFLGLLAIAIISAVIFITKKNAVGAPIVCLDTFNSLLFFFSITMMSFAGIYIAKGVNHLDFGEANVYVSTVILQLLFAVAILVLARLIDVKINFGNFTKALKNALGYFAGSVSVMACGGCISILFKLITGEDIDKQPSVALFMDINTFWLKIFAGVSIVVFAPIVEELFFRGLLYPCVKGWVLRYIGGDDDSQGQDNAFKSKVALVASVIITSALFSVIHSSVFAFLPIFLMGVILACAYEKTNTLLTSIITHMLFNLANVIIITSAIQ